MKRLLWMVLLVWMIVPSVGHAQDDAAWMFDCMGLPENWAVAGLVYGQPEIGLPPYVPMRLGAVATDAWLDMQGEAIEIVPPELYGENFAGFVSFPSADGVDFVGYPYAEDWEFRPGVWWFTNPRDEGHVWVYAFGGFLPERTPCGAWVVDAEAWSVAVGPISQNPHK